MAQTDAATTLTPINELRMLHRKNDYPELLELSKKMQELPEEAALLVALSEIMSGNEPDPKSRLEPLLEHSADNPEWQSDQALAYILIGNVNAAEKVLEEVLKGEPCAVDFGRYATVWVSRGDNETAAEHYREAINREPGRAHWHANLAGILMRMQELEEALENYDSALRIDPEFQSAVNGRQAILVALDRTEELIVALEEQLSRDPEQLALRLQLSRALISNDRFTDGIKCLQDGLQDRDELMDLKEEDPDKFDELKPRQVSLLDALANQWTERARHRMAYAAFRDIQKLEPENLVPSLVGEINCLVEMALYEQAEERVNEAEELFPDENPIKLARTHMLTESDRYDEAEAILRELVEIYPGNANLMANLGQTLMWTGDIDEAGEWYEKAAEINPQQLANMVRARRMPTDPEAIKKMEDIAENKTNHSGPRESMSFALAELHDKNADYDKAFHFLQMGNDLVAKDLNYDPAHFSHIIDRVIAIFNEAYFEDLQPIRGADRTPIFVVGMPRSGTTLTEQILCSHRDVFGAGELDLIPVLRRLMPRVLKQPKAVFPGIVKLLTPELREEAERYYLYGLKQYDEEHAYVVDKLPHNFVNLGLISTILPSAKIIHIQRDPRDNALSNYQQNFKAKHGGMGYAFRLDYIAEEINNYNRVMEHWRKVLPIPMFEITYEELVEDQEGMTRQLLDFVGVDWDENVRDFHKTDRAVRTASVSQVRQPIYKSSKQKWRRYESHLGPLLDNLKPEVVAPWEAARE